MFGDHINTGRWNPKYIPRSNEHHYMRHETVPWQWGGQVHSSSAFCLQGLRLPLQPRIVIRCKNFWSGICTNSIHKNLWGHPCWFSTSGDILTSWEIRERERNTDMFAGFCDTLLSPCFCIPWVDYTVIVVAAFCTQGHQGVVGAISRGPFIVPGYLGPPPTARGHWTLTCCSGNIKQN